MFKNLLAAAAVTLAFVGAGSAATLIPGPGSNASVTAAAANKFLNMESTLCIHSQLYREFGLFFATKKDSSVESGDFTAAYNQCVNLPHHC